MKSEDDYRKDVAALDRLIEEITVDTYSHDEQLWAFRPSDNQGVRFVIDNAKAEIAWRDD